jgi:restriction system protein
MPIPDYQSLMLPVLTFMGDGQEKTLRETIEAMAAQFGLAADERRELLPSGLQPVLDNRVGWARTYLKKAGLLQSPRRGVVQITERGKGVLARKPEGIDVRFLRQFPEFVEFQRPAKKEPQPANNGELVDERTPEEIIEEAYQEARQNLASELLETVKGISPAFFERLVIDLLVRMGYGGTRRDAGEAIGGSGDGGIDGIIKQDRLGLDVVYVQAKRWNGVVGSPEVHKFAGALAGKHAQKGVFITTSHFSSAAHSYVAGIGSKIVLIDGHMMAQLMIDYGIAISPVASYEIKRIDSDYFVED